MPGHIYLPGRIGIIGRSGTLGYEAASQMKALGIGVSTSVGIGGDPINGSSFRDVLEHFENDPETDAVLMIGEIGGPQEAEARRLRPRPHEEAGCRLHRRSLGTEGPQDGPRRRHHLRVRRVGAGEGRDPEGLRRDHRADAVRDGLDSCRACCRQLEEGRLSSRYRAARPASRVRGLLRRRCSAPTVGGFPERLSLRSHCGPKFVTFAATTIGDTRLVKHGDDNAERRAPHAREARRVPAAR